MNLKQSVITGRPPRLVVLQGEALPVERVLREQARGQGDRGDQDAAREAEQGQRAAAVKHGRRVGKESPHLPPEGECDFINQLKDRRANDSDVLVMLK